MTTSRTDKLLGILQTCFSPHEDGWLWLATYLDSQDDGVVTQFEGPYEDAVATGAGLARIITECGVDRAYLALCRAEGRPTEADRELWRELSGLLSTATLVDMVVFSDHRAWSMRADDVAAAS